jgi:DNA polymerase
MESALDWHAAKAALDWQIDLGATEAIGDMPVNRYELEAKPTSAKQTSAKQTSPGAPVAPAPSIDPVAQARVAAQTATDLAALTRALEAFPHCELKKGARNTVVADGKPGARVMILGEAPGRDEDLQGKPFVGRAGQLLDRMLAAIDMSRHAEEPDAAVYISNILPWRPPQNREPTPQETAMLMPFVERHVELARPEILVLMGNTPCNAVLGKRGITRLRGGWTQGLGLPVLPMFHPAYLLRNPGAKREAWADLLALQARLREAKETQS